MRIGYAAVFSVLLGIASRLPAQTPVSLTGVWQATTGVTYGPWTFVFEQRGDSLIGNVRQNGGLRGPADIRGGRTDGTRVTFTALSPTGGRAISFIGTMQGDSIAFVRSVASAAGSTGLFGGRGAERFVVRRADSASAAAALAGPQPASRPAVVPSAGRATAPSREPEWVQHRGYSIDVRNLNGKANRDTVLASIRDQLTLADTVGLDSAKAAFLRTVPIVILATNGGSARYATQVLAPAQVYEKEKPVLLHELMHAYHGRLPDGNRNATIRALFEQARASGKFPAGSYMLSNVSEYFAMMSSVFLHGSAARDPFARDSIRLKQPDMYAWLVREFGPRK